MRDVAERAGVHLSTVSRILNQPPHASASATARRVRAVARELGYQHDPVAASLRSGRTQTIGVVMPRLSDTVVATIYESIEETAAASGYHTLLVGTRDVSRSQERQAELLLSRRVDGLLLGACHLDDQLPQRLDARDAAYVIVMRRSRAHASVTIDDELGGYLATRHLIEQGHARVAMVSGPSTISTAYDRVQGYRRALQEAGIATAPDLVVETGFDVRGDRLRGPRRDGPVSRRRPPGRARSGTRRIPRHRRIVRAPGPAVERPHTARGTRQTRDRAAPGTTGR
jgi:LacI family transcriptional regulator